MYTCLTCSLLIAKFASCGPWTSSLGTTRKNVGFFPLDVSAGRVAEPETNAIPALANSGPTASTSWLPAGPTAATACDAMTASVLVTVVDGVSSVSLSAIETWRCSSELKCATANCAK